MNNQKFINDLKHHNIDAITEHIHKGIDLNITYGGYTPLCHICQNYKGDASLKIIKLLVNKGADIHAGDSDAFRHAAIKGINKAVDFFLKKGVNVNVMDDFAIRFCPLENLALVNLLIKNGANPLAENGIILKYLFLHDNTYNTRLETIKLLVENKVDITSYIEPIVDKIDKDILLIIKRYGLYKALDEDLMINSVSQKRTKL